MTTFGELEEKEIITAAEVVTTLEEYANSGASILSSTVITLLQRCQPKPDMVEWVRLSNACRVGILQQVGSPKDLIEFAKVKRWISRD